MKDTDYKAASATIKKWHPRLLRQSAFFRMADSSGFIEANSILTQNSDYDLRTAQNMDDVNDLFDRATEKIYGQVYAITPHASVVDVLASYYNFNNLKGALFASFRAEPTTVPYIIVDDIPSDEYAAFADPKNDLFDSNLPSHLLNSGIEARAVYEESKSLSLTSTFIDRKAYWWMLALAENTGNTFITGFMQTAIDFYNVYQLTEQRAKKQMHMLEQFLISGGRTPVEQIASQHSRSASAVIPVYYHKLFGDVLHKEISAWEKEGNLKTMGYLLLKMLYATTKNSAFIEYGAEVVFSYLIAREQEIFSSRLLLEAKLKGHNPERIKNSIKNPFM